jgi:Protein of unknown function (DUF2631)
VAAEEPVTSPDQHKPVNVRLARAGGIMSILVLLAMLFPLHHGHVEDVWLVGLAALIAIVLVGDWILRRNGLRS